MAAVTIRESGFPDLPALRDLYRRFVAEKPAQGYPTMDADELDAFVRLLAVQFQVSAQSHTFACWLAEVTGTATGLLAVEICDRAVGRPHRVATPHFLYVLPDWRGMGIARRLIAAGFNWLDRNHPDLTHTEFFAAADDSQWLDRGYRPFVIRYSAKLEDVRAWQPKLANGHDREAEGMGA